MISDDQMDTSEMESQSQRYEQELEIICDFGQLRDDLQDLHEDEEPVEFDELAAQVSIASNFMIHCENIVYICIFQVREIGNRIERTVPPKLRAANRLEDVREKYQSTKSECEDVRKKAKTAKITFQQLRRQRRDMFMSCFDFVAAKIGEFLNSNFV